MTVVRFAIWLLVMWAIVAVISDVHAQAFEDCSQRLTQAEAYGCAQRNSTLAGTQLNEVWQQALALAARHDVGYEKPYKGEVKALRAEQRAWQAYRDAHCKMAGFQNRGGTLEATLVKSCLDTMIRARITDLQGYSGEMAKP